MLVYTRILDPIRKREREREIGRVASCWSVESGTTWMRKRSSHKNNRRCYDRMMMMLSLPPPQIYPTRHKQSNGEQPEQAGGLQGVLRVYECYGTSVARGERESGTIPIPPSLHAVSHAGDYAIAKCSEPEETKALPTARCSYSRLDS